MSIASTASRVAIRAAKSARFQSSRSGAFGYECGQTALTEEFPGVPETQSVQLSGQQPISVSTLSNGLTVASQETGGEATSISLSVAAGSCHETTTNAGVSQMMEKMAFKSTESRSHLRMTRDLEDAGAVVSAKSSREHILYNMEVMRGNASTALSLLAESLCSPHMSQWQLDEQKAVLASDLAELSSSPQAVLTEALHAAAFGDCSPLGHSQYASADACAGMSVDTVSQFHAANYSSNRMVLSASGMDHAQLLSLAESLFGHLPSGAAAAAPQADYVGGEARVAANSSLTYLALALGAPGSNSADAAAVQVLQALLSQSLDGSAASSFSASYSVASLVGAYAAVTPDAVPAAIASMTAALKAAAASPASADSLAAAVARSQASAALGLDTRSGAAQSTAAALLTGKSAPSSSAVAASLAAVSAADVQRVAAAALGGPLSLASLGHTAAVPRAADVAAALN